jgi:hypothetical protein
MLQVRAVATFGQLQVEVLYKAVAVPLVDWAKPLTLEMLRMQTHKLYSVLVKVQQVQSLQLILQQVQ